MVISECHSDTGRETRLAQGKRVKEIVAPSANFLLDFSYGMFYLCSEAEIRKAERQVVVRFVLWGHSCCRDGTQI